MSHYSFDFMGQHAKEPAVRVKGFLLAIIMVLLVVLLKLKIFRLHVGILLFFQACWYSYI